MFEKVVSLLADYSDVPAGEITMDSDCVVDLHIDSVDMVALVMTMEDEFGIQIPDEKLAELHTVGDVVRLLEK